VSGSGPSAPCARIGMFGTSGPRNRSWRPTSPPRCRLLDPRLLLMLVDDRGVVPPVVGAADDQLVGGPGADVNARCLATPSGTSARLATRTNHERRPSGPAQRTSRTDSRSSHPTSAGRRNPLSETVPRIIASTSTRTRQRQRLAYQPLRPHRRNPARGLPCRRPQFRGGTFTATHATLLRPAVGSKG
jgi:hypothetical protein